MGIFEISNLPNFNEFYAFLYLGLINLDLAGCKCFIKNIFDVKIEIGKFEISNVPNFNKF